MAVILGSVLTCPRCELATRETRWIASAKGRFLTAFLLPRCPPRSATGDEASRLDSLNMERSPHVDAPGHRV